MSIIVGYGQINTNLESLHFDFFKLLHLLSIDNVILIY